MLFLLLSGCVVPMNPTANETRPVMPAADPEKTIIVPEGMVWYDSVLRSRGLRFPPGTYVLEAEDSDYWYFRSGAPLELRIFQGDKIVDGKDLPGGIMLAKHFSMVPGAGYIDGEGKTKVMIWKLGASFLNLEGRSWKKTFKQ